MLEPLDANPCEDPRERQDPGRLLQPPDQSAPAARFHGGKSTGSATSALPPALVRAGAQTRPASSRRANCVSSTRVCNLSSRATINSTRSSELSPSSSSVVRAVDLPATREPGDERLERIAAGAAAAGRAPLAPSRGRPRVSASSCLPCAAARRSSTPKSRGCADGRAVARWRREQRASGSTARLKHEHGVHALLPIRRDTHHGRLDHTRLRIQRALHILRKDVQPFRRDDHFLLAALDEDAALRIFVRRCRRCAASPRRRSAAAASESRTSPGTWAPGIWSFVVAARHVFAADENLAVFRDLAPRRRRSACPPIPCWS